MRYGDAKRFFEQAVMMETDECILWPYGLDHKGYGLVNVGGKVKRVHRLSLERRVGPCPPGKESAHSCRSKNCFNYRHLHWAMIRGRTRNVYAKLTKDQVRYVRQQINLGRRSASLSRELGVSPTVISQIKQRLSWAWLDPTVEVVDHGNPGNAKLTEDQVRWIRQQLSLGRSGKDIAREVQTTSATISRIKHNKIWAWFR